mmetsp:Transcript_10190/g.9127  ORF Transcript_10190/g.9127 Transcript_10190/m.9127 type:complete len:213 (-) Transcript_10190:12-650(-)
MSIKLSRDTSLKILDVDPIKTDLLQFIDKNCDGCEYLTNEFRNFKSVSTGEIEKIWNRIDNLSTQIRDSNDHIKDLVYQIKDHDKQLNDQSNLNKVLSDRINGQEKALKRFAGRARKAIIRHFLVLYRERRDNDNLDGMTAELREFLDSDQGIIRFINAGNNAVHKNVDIKDIAEAIECKNDGMVKNQFRALFLFLFGINSEDEVLNEDDEE